MNVRASRFVGPGQLYVMADLSHPEASIASMLDGETLDGSVLVCHPQDEEEVRGLVAQLGEHGDPNEMLTAWRRRDGKR